MEWILAVLWAVSVGGTAALTASICYSRSGRREKKLCSDLSQSRLDNERTVKYLGEMAIESAHLRAELDQAKLNARVLEETNQPTFTIRPTQC